MRNWALSFAIVLTSSLAQAQAQAQVQTIGSGSFDVCKKQWENGLGSLVEVSPSQLPGFRQMQQTDGNLVFISKKCDKVFVGEFFTRADLGRRAPPLELVDRSTIDFGRMTSIGNPTPKSSWIFVMGRMNLGDFSVEIDKQPKILKDGYYLGFAAEDGIVAQACHYEKIEAIKKEGGHPECSLSLGEGVKLAGASLPFAIAPDGVRWTVDSWARFFREPR